VITLITLRNLQPGKLPLARKGGSCRTQLCNPCLLTTNDHQPTHVGFLRLIDFFTLSTTARVLVLLQRARPFAYTYTYRYSSSFFPFLIHAFFLSLSFSFFFFRCVVPPPLPLASSICLGDEKVGREGLLSFCGRLFHFSETVGCAAHTLCPSCEISLWYAFVTVCIVGRRGMFLSVSFAAAG
jgi:hypothetical protein